MQYFSLVTTQVTDLSAFRANQTAKNQDKIKKYLDKVHLSY